MGHIYFDFYQKAYLSLQLRTCDLGKGTHKFKHEISYLNPEFQV